MCLVGWVFGSVLVGCVIVVVGYVFVEKDDVMFIDEVLLFVRVVLFIMINLGK